MIRSADITVVMQGDIRPDTHEAIDAVRRLLPDAQLVFSTWPTESAEQIRHRADALVFSDDPGALPPFTKAASSPPSSLNRQLVSTQAGLVRSQTPYTLKIRSDILLTGAGFLHAASASSAQVRLLVSTFYTRHPRGLSCYLFHVSDWFVFGHTERVKNYFSAPLMSTEDARWFESHPHTANSTYAARRFRARYTPEQHITTHYARLHGYRTPEFLNDCNDLLVREYERFLATECIVAMPRTLGFRLPKYQHLEKSLYQRIDCVAHEDWRRLGTAFGIDDEIIFDSEPGKKYSHCLRLLSHPIRHPIVKACVMSRCLTQVR